MPIKKQKTQSIIERLKIGSTTFSIYPNNGSYLLYYSENGKKIRKNYKTIKEAKSAARNTKITKRRDAITLTGQALNEYKATLDILNAHAKLSDMPERPRMDILVQEAIKSQRQNHDTFTPKLTQDVYDLWTKQKEANGRSTRTLEDCTRLKRFISAFPGYIHEITEDEIIEWNNDLRKLNGKKYAERSKYNFQASVIGFFNYAKRFKYLPNKPHNAEILNNVKARKGVEEIGVWQPEQYKLMLNESLKMWSAGTKVKRVTLWVAIGGMAGLRIAEISRMEWEHILWKTDYIRVPSLNSKNKKTHRKVPICPALRAWMEYALKDVDYENMTGEMFPHSESYVTERITDLVKNKIKMPYVDNGLRHTCISSWVAQGLGEYQAAFWAGNSGEACKANYVGEFTKEEGEEWHSIMPPHK